MNHVARRYAQALFDCQIPEDTLCSIADEIMGIPALWDALNNPSFRTEEKLSVVKSLPLLAKEDKIRHFFCLLLESKRLPILRDILAEFHEVNLVAISATECHMTCLTIPQKEQQDKICAMLCKIHHKENVRLIFHIDPAILGGFILEIDGITYDRSVRGSIKDLSRYLKEVNTI